MMERSSFQRVVLGLQHHSAKQGLSLAIEMAALLRLDLCGFFVKEESLGRLAALPFSRELRPLGGGWRPLDEAGLAQDLELAAIRAQRLFEETVKGRGVTSQFQVVNGSLLETLALLSRGGDIVVLSTPSGTAALGAPALPALVETAIRTTGAVMLVSEGARWRRGPIVALATTRDDPSINVAAGIAAQAKDELFVFEAYGPRPSVTEDAGIKARRLAGEISGSLASPHVISSLESSGGRLVVLREGSGSEAVMLGSRLRIPVLIVSASDEVGRTTCAASYQG
jgi:hypothetical protein